MRNTFEQEGDVRGTDLLAGLVACGRCGKKKSVSRLRTVINAKAPPALPRRRQVSASNKHARQPSRIFRGSPFEKIRTATAMKPRPEDMFSVNIVV